MNWQQYCETKIPHIKQNYLKFHGVELDLANPKTFTEKLQWLKVYDSTFLKAFCSDKLRVHDYYRAVLGKDIGVPVVKRYKNLQSLFNDRLDTPCIIKCNHGSGMNMVINESSTEQISVLKERFTRWIAMDHGTKWDEMYYSLIEPVIYQEKYLNELRDIKVFCFNGEPKFVQIDCHFAEHRMNFYDTEWRPLEWLSNAEYPANYTIMDKCPKQLNTILGYAKKLSMPFKFVRCDFIISDGNLYGGELTFIPGAGNQSYLGDGDQLLGNMLDLQ